MERPNPRESSSSAAVERMRAMAAASWKEWLRDDFLRSCFVGVSLAWDGLGAIQMRYLLDPWFPGQGAPPAWVYAAMAGFISASLVAQVFLYRLWWPSDGRTKSIAPRRLNWPWSQAARRR